MPYLNTALDSTALDADTAIDLYYDDNRGLREDRGPVVLVHGWMQTGRIWEAQVRALVDQGHRVITYDRRGFGQSSKPWGGYHFDAFAADLHALLTHLDLHDVALVGFSNGGGDVARYLGTHGSDRVDRAAFVSATPPYCFAAPDNPEGTLTDDVVHALQKGLRDDRPAFVDHLVREMFTPSGSTTERVSRPAHDDAVSLALTAAPSAAIESVDAWRTDFRGDLARIDIPTLVVHGDSDRLLPVEVFGLRTFRSLADSTLKLVEGGPHGICTTHADEVNAALVTFLSS
jgi:pimeloyl-ACP methyl ester carboxylesterase